MKLSEIKVGDFVKVHDGSYGVRVDGFEVSSHIGIISNAFEVIGKINTVALVSNNGNGVPVHDIFIVDMKTGKTYLHSAGFVRSLPKPPKEMTLPEIIKELGYEVKIVK